MTNIENATSTWMNKLYGDYTKSFIADGREDPFGRAYTKAVTIGLRKATNRAGIFDAIYNIQKKVTYRQIPPDVHDYIVTQGDANPMDLRGLLILACAVRVNTTTPVIGASN